MKLKDILNEADWGDMELARTIENRGQRKPNDINSGWWLIDSASGKKITGPFADKEAALRFKTNRPDKVPANAVARPV